MGSIPDPGLGVRADFALGMCSFLLPWNKLDRLMDVYHTKAVAKWIWTSWDSRVPGGKSRKRPDFIYMCKRNYVHIECDENGHIGYNQQNETARLIEISKDLKKPGLVKRIDPDTNPCFERTRKDNGEPCVFVPARGPKRRQFRRIVRQAVDAAAAWILFGTPGEAMNPPQKFTIPRFG